MSQSTRSSNSHAILLRIGCDSGKDGGKWNAPINTKTGEYAYVPIPGGESQWNHICKCPTYAFFAAAVEALGDKLPRHLAASTKCHLDPDFKELTHGESSPETDKYSPRFQAISELQEGDTIVFYASFRSTNPRAKRLIYALIGIFEIARTRRVRELTRRERKRYAHGRRVNSGGDLVFKAAPKSSGRFSKAIIIPCNPGKSYRVPRKMAKAWGGLSRTWIQRSFRPPSFENYSKFGAWLRRQRRRRGIRLLHTNV